MTTVKVGILLLLVGTFAAWAYFGFPSPDTFVALSGAKAACQRFVNENRQKVFADADGAEIRPISMWMKNGKIVVEVGAVKAGDPSYNYRLCVIGGGQIEVVSIF